MQFERCTSCGGFVVAGRGECPHCAAAQPAGVAPGKVGVALLGGALAFTLMACYGMPPRPAPSPDNPTSPVDGGSPIEPVPATSPAPAAK